ncbi:MAG: anti-sigma factor [Pyrinomonadaceae bacterium]
MSDQEKENVLDLLYDRYAFGLSEEEAAELERLGYDPSEAESIERTIAVLGLTGLDPEARMPDSLRSKLTLDADKFFGSKPADDAAVPQRQIVLDGGSARPWFGWLGWAAAAAACIALAVTLLVPRTGDVVVVPPTPTPEERLTPAQERQKLIGSPGLVTAEWAKAKMEEITVSGDVVWSPGKQTGYLRLRGLPKNDPTKESYQLWIVDPSQEKPIDGGVFDITVDGEAIIPIDANLNAPNPKLFAITIEKPGGVVVSEMKKFAAQAPVKPDNS